MQGQIMVNMSIFVNPTYSQIMKQEGLLALDFINFMAMMVKPNLSEVNTALRTELVIIRVININTL